MTEAGCALHAHVQAGPQAVKDSIDEDSRHTATDSLAFDDVQRDSPTFDYLLGVARGGGTVVALEIHPANAGEVGTVLAKQARTLEALAAHRCQACRIDAWIWVASSRVDLPPRSAKRWLLAQHGILGPHGRIDLRRI